MTTNAPDQRRPDQRRHLAPIRWPKPNAHGVGLLAIWALGVAISIVIPAILVPPTGTASDGRVLTAFGVTVIGVLIMMGVGLALYRRYREAGLLVFMLVPSFTILGGGFILMGLKLFG